MNDSHFRTPSGLRNDESQPIALKTAEEAEKEQLEVQASVYLQRWKPLVSKVGTGIMTSMSGTRRTVMPGGTPEESADLKKWGMVNVQETRQTGVEFGTTKYLELTDQLRAQGYADPRSFFYRTDIYPIPEPLPVPGANTYLWVHDPLKGRDAHVSYESNKEHSWDFMKRLRADVIAIAEKATYEQWADLSLQHEPGELCDFFARLYGSRLNKYLQSAKTDAERNTIRVAIGLEFGKLITYARKRARVSSKDNEPADNCSRYTQHLQYDGEFERLLGSTTIQVRASVRDGVHRTFEQPKYPN